MKRTPLKRNKGGSRFPKRRCPEYMDWLKAQILAGAFCDVCGGPSTGVVRAHLQAKGSAGDDLNNVALLCFWCHGLQEKRTDAFIKDCGVDLWAKAREHTARWEQEREAA